MLTYHLIKAVYYIATDVTSAITIINKDIVLVVSSVLSVVSLVLLFGVTWYYIPVITGTS